MTWTSKTRSVTPGSCGRMSACVAAGATAGAAVGTAAWAVRTPDGTARAASAATTARRLLRRCRGVTCAGGASVEGCSISLPLRRGPCVGLRTGRASVRCAVTIRGRARSGQRVATCCPWPDGGRPGVRSGRAAGRAALDELRREQRRTGGRRGRRAELGQEPLDRERPEVAQRRRDGREGRGAEVRAEDVVEPDDA